MNWLSRFLYGRNGVDALNVALFVVIFFFTILGWIFGFFPVISQVVPLIFTIIQAGILGLFLFRAISKNIGARQAENQIFLRFANKTKMLFSAHKRNKDYRFFKCPSCHLNLRVPKGKGSIFITCPQCGERFKKNT